MDLTRDRRREKCVKPSTLASATLCALLSTFASAAGSEAGIQARDAWIRWLPANIPSGAYLTLINSGTAPQVLVSAASPDFAEVSFHQTRTVNGLSEMSAVSALTISPQSSLQFAPGGYHIMLMQPSRTLHPGDHVPITLRFADGKSLQVSFEVRSATAVSLPAQPPR
jgi:periplasmic copper chaperone A